MSVIIPNKFIIQLLELIKYKKKNHVGFETKQCVWCLIFWERSEFRKVMSRELELFTLLIWNTN